MTVISYNEEKGSRLKFYFYFLTVYMSIYPCICTSIYMFSNARSIKSPMVLVIGMWAIQHVWYEMNAGPQRKQYLLATEQSLQPYILIVIEVVSFDLLENVSLEESFGESKWTDFTSMSMMKQFCEWCPHRSFFREFLQIWWWPGGKEVNLDK